MSIAREILKLVDRSFQLGDRVRIRHDSEYRYQNDGVGEIIYVRRGRDFKFAVRFGQYENEYREKDLIHAE